MNEPGHRSPDAVHVAAEFGRIEQFKDLNCLWIYEFILAELLNRVEEVYFF